MMLSSPGTYIPPPPTGKFIANYLSATVIDTYIYSTDGISWDVGYYPDSGYLYVAYGNGIFVSIINGGSAYSSDGITWQTGGALTFSGSGAPLYGYTKLVYGNGLFVAASGYYSSDGITWTAPNGSAPSTRQTIAFANNIFAIPGYRSVDGINWTASSLTATRIFGVNGKFIAQFGGNIVRYSTDGISWTATSGLPTTSSPVGVTYGNGVWVLVMSTIEYSFYSTDGITWYQSSSPIIANVPPPATFNGNEGLAFGNGVFVLTGGYMAPSGDIVTSTDGINWSSLVGPPIGYGGLNPISLIYGG